MGDMESLFLNPHAVIQAAHIRAGSRVADLAAGSGFFARAAARHAGLEGEVWAVDPHPGLLARLKNLAAAEGLRNIEVLRGTPDRVGGTRLPDNSMDVCIIANALFSLSDRAAAATEARRVLRKAGRVVLVDWSGSHGGLGPHPEHVVTKKEAQELFERAGFAGAEDIPAGSYHWGLILRKTL